MKRRLIAIVLLILFFHAAAALADEAMDAVKIPIQKGIDLLGDPAYADASKKAEQREKIWEIIKQAFDFTQISILAVARDWRRFSDAERKEFTQVFSDLLGETYLDRIQGEYSNETVTFLDEESLSDKKAVVRTHIVRANTNIPVDYRVIRTKDGWKVYDVRVEGVSLVKNYRDQFKQILMNDTPAQLIDQLKKKLADIKSE